MHSQEHTTFSFDSLPDAPPEGERWSSWDGATHGPKPRPDWVITALGAVESDLGILKSGKEADVHVVRRWVPDGTTSRADGSSRPSGTAPASTACSTAMPATRRVAGSAAAVRCGRWRAAPSSAASC